MMTLPIKIRINIELLIDGRAELFILNGQCKDKGLSEEG